VQGSGAFAPAGESAWTHLGAGVRRQILGHDAQLMMVAVDFDAGAVGAVHHHPHRQATYVARGRFEVTVGGERRVLAQGDGFFASPSVPHGVRALDAGTLIDIFAPARDDFLAAR
jgi:quercetin dioxygenase-like cupin family protein